MMSRWLDVLFHRARDNSSGDFLRQSSRKADRRGSAAVSPILLRCRIHDPSGVTTSWSGQLSGKHTGISTSVCQGTRGQVETRGPDKARNEDRAPVVPFARSGDTSIS